MVSSNQGQSGKAPNSNHQPLSDAIIQGNRQQAEQLTQQFVDAGDNLQEILAALVAGMDEVGKRFKANEMFVPEVLIAARAMKMAMAILEPKLTEAGFKPTHTAVIGTVEGDLHDIGKNLVAMMWRGANVNVIDLGTNVSPQKFVDAAREHGATIIGLSALLTTTMPAMKRCIESIKAEGMTDAKVLIGGAPITQQFADQIGADGYASDAASAVDKLRELVGAN